MKVRKVVHRNLDLLGYRLMAHRVPGVRVPLDAENIQQLPPIPLFCSVVSPGIRKVVVNLASREVCEADDGKGGN